MTAAVVLRRAANALSAGEIPWGRNWFIDPETACRCAGGAITYAANPDDQDGDPMYAGPAAWAAMYALADYLVTELGAARCTTPADIEDDDDLPVLDPVETVGGWNDAPERTLTDVIAALEAAADRADVMAVSA